MPYGATLAEWEAFASLDLPNLLPYVADPDVPTHPSSKVKAGQKIPGFVYEGARGYGVMGFRAWNDPAKITRSVDDWKKDSRLGICLRMMTIKAFDIDVPNLEAAMEIEAYIREFFGVDGMMLPVRTRQGTGKRAMIYRLREPEAISLHRVHIDRNLGMVEFLGDKQHLCVAGGHPEGGRYEWDDGLPTKLSQIPELDLDQVLELARQLADDFAPKGWHREWRHKTEYTPRSYKADAFDDDPAVKHIIDTEWFIDFSVNGGIYVRCPWTHYHSRDSGPTEAEFFPAGSNGLENPGFKCLHGHSLCPTGPFSPTGTEFLNAIGFTAIEVTKEFEIVEAPKDNPAATRPKFSYKGKTNRIEAVLPNVVSMLHWTEGTHYTVRYDSFKDTILYRNGSGGWKPIIDETYTEIQLRFMALGIESTLSEDLVKKGLRFVAKDLQMDSAKEWLNSLQWDGVPRIENFHRRVLKLPNDPYYVAVCRYMWTALAGRVLEPGCKADMVPILTGAQGLRKSSLVEALAPSRDEYTVVSLNDREENLARQLRGRMVLEWDELRGLMTRDAESIKGWVSRRKDDWIPKFKEFATSLERRFLLIGTANPQRFLNDPTGHRRWLPMFITEVIDVDYVTDNREQLWAEAAVMYHRHLAATNGRSGVMYEEAEQLAKAAQRRATVRDPWVDALQQWADAEDRNAGTSSLDILHQACSIGTSQITYGTQDRLIRALTYLGWDQNEAGLWFPPLA
jgi:hypothetical protein